MMVGLGYPDADGDEAWDIEPCPECQVQNQCDGCQAGIPVDENGNHRMGRPGGYPDLMGCQRGKYAPKAI
jgi:hypothetical protein